MVGVPLTVRCLVATGAAAALIGCSPGSDTGSDTGSDPASGPASGPRPESATSSAATTAAPAVDPGRQAYLDAVNSLCDALLPKVVEATRGGSTDVPATEWVTTWPAHKALLDGFDADLAKVTVPPAAKDSAEVMAAYVVWANGIDERRITAARKGEKAWQAELAAEVGIESTPALTALGPAGFSQNCQAR
ncbi:MAG TPA: hypothetical protein VFV89_20360 [Nocardioides sp.]|uniref:hypothetical protein n=1 Tax=Nocardioides sp. TaxID=35761 RepID=UPI002E31524D|nr:hypothetical protein [Nocardioides sp.]HEX5090173.1 hypothetical protein [Nocardioides sp.]